MRRFLPGIALAFTCLSAGSASAGVGFTMIDQGLVDETFAEEVRGLSTSRARSFVGFLGQGMLGQSFTMQHGALEGSAVTSSASGLHLGIRLDTFPFTPNPTNLLGKEENTHFVPALPRLSIGYSGGEKVRWGIGYSINPPVTVGGATALVLGADGSVGFTVSPRVRVGLEADATVGQAIAPVTATPAQKEAGTLENVDEARYDEVCAPQPYGCLDTLSIKHGGLRVVAALEVSRVAQPYVKLGAEYISETFEVQVDLSKYRLSGLEPNVGAGVNLALHPRLRVGIDALTSYRPAAYSDDLKAGVLFKLELGISYQL